MHIKITLAVVLALISFTTKAYSAALYDISRPTFAGLIEPSKNYKISQPAERGSISRRNLHRKRLYFFVSIIGGKKSLDYLGKNGFLGLKATIWADGIKLDDVEFGISPKDWDTSENRIREEFNARDVFTWRTYMFTRKTWYTEIVLVLKDDKNRVVSPIGYSGTFNAIVQIVD